MERIKKRHEINDQIASTNWYHFCINSNSCWHFCWVAYHSWMGIPIQVIDIEMYSFDHEWNEGFYFIWCPYYTYIVFIYSIGIHLLFSYFHILLVWRLSIPYGFHIHIAECGDRKCDSIKATAFWWTHLLLLIKLFLLCMLTSTIDIHPFAPILCDIIGLSIGKQTNKQTENAPNICICMLINRKGQTIIHPVMPLLLAIIKIESLTK